MHSDAYNEMMTARAEGEPEPEPQLVVAAEAPEADGGPIDTTTPYGFENGPELFVPCAPGRVQVTHFQGDDCPGGHYDDLPAVEAPADLCAPPAPTLDGVSDGTTFYVRNGIRIAFPGEHTADEVEEAFRGAGF